MKVNFSHSKSYPRKPGHPSAQQYYYIEGASAGDSGHRSPQKQKLYADDTLPLISTVCEDGGGQ